jgi:hypothetical protein
VANPASDANATTGSANATGPDAVGLRLCGEASAELVPSGRLAVWHHGLLLGLGLMGFGVATSACMVGWGCECRRRRQRRRWLGLQRDGEVEREGRAEGARRGVKPD